MELTHLAVTDLGVLTSVLKDMGKNPLNEGLLLTLNYISLPPHLLKPSYFIHIVVKVRVACEQAV